MRAIPIRFVMLILGLIVGVTGQARAGLITYDFAGVVSNEFTVNATAPPGVTDGAAFTGTIVFDDSKVGTGSGTQLRYADSIQSFVVTIGSTTYDGSAFLSRYVSSENRTILANEMSHEDFVSARVLSYNDSDLTNYRVASMELFLDDQESPIADGLTSTQLANLSLDLSKFGTSKIFEIRDDVSNANTGVVSSRFFLHGNLTTLTLENPSVNATTPEPSTLAGAASGLLTLAGYAWRKRRRMVAVA